MCRAIAEFYYELLGGRGHVSVSKQRTAGKSEVDAMNSRRTRRKNSQRTLTSEKKVVTIRHVSSLRSRRARRSDPSTDKRDQEQTA